MGARRRHRIAATRAAPEEAVLKQLTTIRTRSSSSTDHTLIRPAALPGARRFQPVAALSSGALKCIERATYPRGIFERTTLSALPEGRRERSPRSGDRGSCAGSRAASSRHGVKYTANPSTAAELSARYINDRHLPDRRSRDRRAGAAWRILPKSKQKKVISEAGSRRSSPRSPACPPQRLQRRPLSVEEPSIKPEGLVFSQDKRSTRSRRRSRWRAAAWATHEARRQLLFSGPRRGQDRARQLAFIMGVELILRQAVHGRRSRGCRRAARLRRLRPGGCSPRPSRSTLLGAAA